MNQTEAMRVLANVVPAHDPLWQSVMMVLGEARDLERGLAFQPTLTDGDRQYYAGRAAGVEAVLTLLADVQAKAAQDRALRESAK